MRKGRTSIAVSDETLKDIKKEMKKMPYPFCDLSITKFLEWYFR